MKFPSKKTCAYAILEYLHVGGIKTKGQIIRYLDGRFVRQTVEDKINELAVNAMLTMQDAGLNISTLARRHLDQCEIDEAEKPAPTTSVASTRLAKPFTPLRNYKLDRGGMRPGSNDYRNWPSRHLP